MNLDILTELFPYLFAILLCSVLGWFFLVHILFKTLRERHSEKYISMGSPSFMPKENPMKELWGFTKFLFKREWRELDDDKLALLGKFMLFYLITYFVGFLFLLSLLFLGYAPQ